MTRILVALRSSRRCFSTAHKAVKCGHTLHKAGSFALGLPVTLSPKCPALQIAFAVACSSCVRRAQARVWRRLAQQQDLEQDILAWEGLLAPEETAARDAVRAWVDTRFAPRITEACSHTTVLLL